MNKQEHSAYSNRRQYIRLDSVFPVRFKVLDAAGNSLSGWIQGFTHNVSSGGILLDLDVIDGPTLLLLQRNDILLSIQIRMPLHRPAVLASAKIAWLRESEDDHEKYAAGLTYTLIEPAGRTRIMRYVGIKKNAPVAIIALFLLMSAAFGYNGYVNYLLVKSNKALVKQFIDILQESSVAKEKIKQISRDKEGLQLKIGALESRIGSLDQETSKSNDRAKELAAAIDKLSLEKAAFQEQLIAIQRKETTVTEELLRLGEKKSALGKANIDAMYRWLAVHQNARTGLVMSFEGDTDLYRWSFVYDQSLALQVYLNFSDFDRARKLLDFFNRKAKRKDEMFFNAYYADDGSPAEYVLHSGPNLWIGIGVCQYTFKTKDTRYLHIAEEVAGRIMALQKEDKEGGIRGGPDVEWYATEHNLDAYAFFSMLKQITGKPEYAAAAETTLNWLVQHTYDKMDVPVARGKGDSTIATDTYAWSIAAIGPQKLSELGMNPDKIIEFAEQNCTVEVPFIRLDGQKVTLKGFDFAPQRNVARGGIVSSEWTAQMIVSLRMMAEYYHSRGMTAKAVSYEEKADEFINQLCNMIITSPSPSGQGEGCLPYASSDFVDTGHGWMTPKGKLTGSVSGTAYTIFAYYHYNPLQLKE
jgi:hypothetical protein